MEVHFIKATYANSIVQRPFPNGIDVDLDLIVEAIRDQLETVGGSIEKVVILLDREGRARSAASIAEEIVSKLVGAGVTRKLYVGVTDRQIENWILADEPTVKSKYGKPSYTYPGDATFGRGVLRELNGGIDPGFRDKAALLKGSSASAAACCSASLKAFISQVDFDWHWANT